MLAVATVTKPPPAVAGATPTRAAPPQPTATPSPPGAVRANAPADALGATLARAVRNRAERGALLQRKVYEDSGTWKCNDVRPDWQVKAEQSLLLAHNLKHGTSATAVDYVAERLDRCHILSFENIQAQLLVYLNTKDETAYTEWLLVMVGDMPDWATVEPTARNLTILVNQPGSAAEIAQAANKLLGQLNSLTENLRAASKYLNRYIGPNLDPHGGYSPGGHWHADAATRHATELATDGPLLTPQHHSRLITSEGPVPLGSISPTYQSQLQDRPLETRGVRSARTMKAFYPGNKTKSLKGTGIHKVNLGVAPAPKDLKGKLGQYRRLKKLANPTPSDLNKIKLIEQVLKDAKWIT